jgi:alpha-aminoadipic semialdehyde synthase
MTKATTLSAPFYKTRPTCLPAEYPPVQIMSVDILPTSIPLDASQHFSRSLLPYLESLIGTFDGSKSGEYTEALERATIAKEGKLAEKHAWLQSAVNAYHAKAATTETVGSSTETIASTPRAEPETTAVPQTLRTTKKVLMLGSGMVAGPAVNTIAKRGDVELVIASNSLQELQTLVRSHLNVKYRIIDVSNTSSYEHLIKDADVVIRFAACAIGRLNFAYMFATAIASCPPPCMLMLLSYVFFTVSTW